MQEAFISPTLNLVAIDEHCSMVHHFHKLLPCPFTPAAIQTFAFGGVNTRLLVRKLT